MTKPEGVHHEPVCDAAPASGLRGGEAEPSAEGGPGYDRGSVLWHCSEEDGGPDVGIQVGLGGGWTLYFGELAEATLEDHGIGEELRASWWVVLWGPGTERVLGAVPDTYEAREAAEEIAARMRSTPSSPTQVMDRDTGGGGE